MPGLDFSPATAFRHGMIYCSTSESMLRLVERLNYTHCPLFIAHCLRPPAHRLLFTGRYPVFTPHCLLLTANCPLLPGRCSPSANLNIFFTSNRYIARGRCIEDTVRTVDSGHLARAMDTGQRTVDSGISVGDIIFLLN
jgi:hypothetical protein